MRRLSEIEGEEAVDVLAELMTPVTEILADTTIAKEFKKKDKKMVTIVALAVKGHKDALINTLCLLAGVTRKEYLKKANVVSIMDDALYIMNDPVMKEVFTSQVQSAVDESSGLATEIIEADEK